MKPERVLMHCVTPILRNQSNLVIARALDLKEDGSEVAVTYCDEASGTCSANLIGNPLVCARCRRTAKAMIESVGLTAIPVHGGAGADHNRNRETLSAKKTIATAVDSNLVTQLRAMPNELKKRALCRIIKRKYFHTSMSLLSDYRKIVGAFKPDRIEVLNGRHGCSKYPLLVADDERIPFNTLEYTLRHRPIIFKGHTPHDRSAFQKRVLEQPADEEVGERYYSGRRCASLNKFAKSHLGFKPDPRAKAFDSKVTFFLSSQDECASLGKAWRSPFPSDSAVVAETCARFPDKFFCVRFHPNQAGIAGDVTKPYKALAKLDNLQIYPPHSKINTYDLIAWSDCVVTFASTVAIEACWMQKPAIQLGPSFYDELDISYTPHSLDEFFSLLERDDLKAGSRQNAARFACYALLESDEVRNLHIDGRRNRVRGMGAVSRLGLKLSKRVNNLMKGSVKVYLRLAG